MRAPGEILADLVAKDPTAPRLTWYDDTPGPTAGERIELSGRVLANWVAKCANALVDALDADAGSRIRLDLPPDHWRTAYWALATWAVGGVVDLSTHGEPASLPDVLVTDDPDRAAGSAEAGDLVVVTLAALARTRPGGVPAGAMDEAAELATYGDRFDLSRHPTPDSPALVDDDAAVRYADLVPAAQWPVGSRVLVDGTPADLLRAMLCAWDGGGSVVLVRGADPALMAGRLAQEGIAVDLRPRHAG